MRAEALDGEGPGDPDYPVVLAWLVKEMLELGLCRDRGIYLPLARYASVPPLCVKLLPAIAPRLVRIARDLPFLKGFRNLCIKCLAQRLTGVLPSFPDDIDFRVVRDRFKRDVRHALVDKAVSNVS